MDGRNATQLSPELVDMNDTLPVKGLRAAESQSLSRSG